MNYKSLQLAKERLKNEFPVGTRVVLLEMDDSQAPPIGTRGTVKHIDDMATIFVKWDNGSSLGIAYGKDICRKLTKEELEEEKNV